jgi:hypothetical protein
MSATAYLCGRARLAFLLGGTAAIALLAGKPAHAITLNDLVNPNPTANLNVGVDTSNQFPNVVSLFNPTSGSFCTGTSMPAQF